MPRPERLDLNDRDLRLAKEMGCRIAINSDSHDSRNLGKMEYGIRQLRRAWLGPQDVLNTREAKEFLAGAQAAGHDRWKVIASRTFYRGAAAAWHEISHRK